MNNKKLILLFLCIVNVLSLKAQDSGIRFFQGSWKELLAAAKTSGKSVFVDVYTDWCGPCKKMEKEIFILPEVAGFYNAHFISYRLNAEKNEGPSLASQYQVKAYPTWLFLNGDGTLHSRHTDYLPAAQFINIGKLALGSSPVADSLAMLKQRFDKGERGISFLHNYLESLKRLELNNREVLEAYTSILRRAKGISPTEIQFLIKYSGRTWTSAIPLITDHLSILENSQQKQAASDLFSNVLYFVWGNAVKTKDVEVAQRSKLLTDKLLPLLNEQKQRSYNQIALFHYRTFKDKPRLKTLAYRMAREPMSVDTAFAFSQDRLLFEKVKAAYAQLPKDSADRKAFEEEKKLAKRQYSGQLASQLFQLAEAFAEVLNRKDPGHQDALRWAERAYLLVPNPGTKQLMERITQESQNRRSRP